MKLLSPVKGLVVLKVLPESFQENPELAKLQIFWTVFVLGLGYIFGTMERGIDGLFAVEKVVTVQHIPHAFVNLELQPQKNGRSCNHCNHLTY